MRTPLTAAALALCLASTDARADEPTIKHEKFELANGLRVILVEDHAAPQIAVVTWYRVGSKDEAKGKTGFAHLFEHLMFKGSAHVADGVIDDLFEAAGGWTNAYTWFDETVYQDVASSEFLERALWLEADRLAGLTETLSQAKLDNQRDVVRNERRQSYENRPYGMASWIIQENLWPEAFGYHWDTIGSHEDLVAASVDDVKAFFDRYYVPNNAVLVIAGDFDPKEARKLVEKYFGWIPKGADPQKPKYATPAPIKKEVVLTDKDDVQVPKTFLVWRAPKAFDKDEAAMEVAAQILGEGKNSRLYKRLVFDERKAQEVDIGMHGFLLGGQFEIDVTPKPGVETAQLVKAVDEELARLAKSGPTAEELERAKNGHEAGSLSSLEGVMGRALRVARYDVMVGDTNYLAKDLARYRDVTGKDVARVVGQYLKKDNRVNLTIIPEAK